MKIHISGHGHPTLTEGFEKAFEGQVKGQHPNAEVTYSWGKGAAEAPVGWQRIQEALAGAVTVTRQPDSKDTSCSDQGKQLPVSTQQNSLPADATISEPLPLDNTSQAPVDSSSQTPTKQDAFGVALNVKQSILDMRTQGSVTKTKLGGLDVEIRRKRTTLVVDETEISVKKNS